MEEKYNNHISLKDTLLSIYNKNKLKFLMSIFTLLLLIFTFIFNSEKNKKQNILLSEKFVRAGLMLSAGNNEDAKIYYSEIILSKNKFYSVLALNKLIEENLEDNKTQILKFFSIIENLDISKDTLDLILFKKALYLMDNSEIKKSKEILQVFIKDNSQFKTLAQELISEK